jgi:hypothetical protein
LNLLLEPVAHLAEGGLEDRQGNTLASLAIGTRIWRDPRFPCGLGLASVFGRRFGQYSSHRFATWSARVQDLDQEGPDSHHRIPDTVPPGVLSLHGSGHDVLSGQKAPQGLQMLEEIVLETISEVG